MRAIILPISWIAINCFLLSCSENVDASNKTHYTITQEGNKTTVHSNEVDSLKALINLQFLKPISAEYHYVFYDNSGENDRLGVPGPSDCYLQAVLTYDSTGINEVIRARGAQSIRRPQYDHSEFKFDWLNQQDKNDLNFVSDSINGSPAIMYASQPLTNGGYLITERKVFLKLSNN